MPIHHHTGAATLMSYSSGTLGEALSAVVASHLAGCPHCRTELARMDVIGGALLGALPASPLTTPQPNPGPAALEAPSRAPPAGPRSLPAPLARLTSASLDTIRWKILAPGVWHHRLTLSPTATGDLRFIKIAPGQVMPEHGHGGAELTLVLDGSYTDATGFYAAGDLADLDNGVEHQPVSDPYTGCICLIASEKPARFKSLLARLVQPLTGL